MAINLPALRFEAEAFQLGEGKIMGRHSAGEAFLRAILALPDLTELYGYGPNPASHPALAGIVAASRPDIATRWIQTGSSKALHQVGKLHHPDPMIAEPARQRLASGPASWSITGITHTISSLDSMRAIIDLTIAPVMEWDGIILTSEAVRQSINQLLGEQLEYLAWRMPGAQRPPLPRMPVIPLGVHCSDFVTSAKDRTAARRALGLKRDEVAFLFLGRLSFHAKANPFAQYIALEEAAKRTGKRLVMLHCGWFATRHIEKAIKDAAPRYAPSVRHIWLDGRDGLQRTRCWAAGDIFLSLADNIQETFGLTPLEAMSAGMPVIASDWNGYRETVRHAECGFRVPTSAPEPPAGGTYAAVHAMELVSYDAYLSHTSRHVGVDIAALIESMVSLITEPELRRTMGEAGRRIARSEYDWSVIMQRYLEFWAELDGIRTSASPTLKAPLPAYPDRMDPYRLFGHYPTRQIGMGTVLRRSARDLHWAQLIQDPLFRHGRQSLPPPPYFEALLGTYPAASAIALGDACTSIRMSRKSAILAASLLVKMGILEIA